MKNTSSEIHIIFSGMKNRRVKFYKKMIKELNEIDEMNMSVERLIAYEMTLWNFLLSNNDFKKMVLAEIERLWKDDVKIN